MEPYAGLVPENFRTRNVGVHPCEVLCLSPLLSTSSQGAVF